MSDTQETLTNTPQSEPAAELERTFSLIQQELESETKKSSEQKDALKNYEQAVEGCLARAKNYYTKKEWARAFAEWDKVCTFLPEQEEFRKKVALLKESHENLTKVNRELVEIKEILNRRSSPPAADRKFIQDANEQTHRQIKNVYSYLSQQLRVERTPKTLSFWWPVLLGVVLLGVGYGSLSMHYAKMRTQWSQEAEKMGQDLRSERASLQAQRADLLKQNMDVKLDYETKLEELKQQNAGWRNAGREKIEDMENRIKELETENKALKRQTEALIQENLGR